MKRLLVLAALLSIPALADACHVPSNIIETWTTYCDGGVEKVRLTLTFTLNITGLDFSEHESEFGICDRYCPRDEPRAGTVTYLGDGNWQVVHQGWTRDCLASDTLLRGGVLTTWRCYYGEFGESDLVFMSVQCSDGPQPIIDNVTCAPLPVASSTWGAIKALYRSTGDKP